MSYRDRRIIKCKSCGYNAIASKSGAHASCLSCGWGHAVAYHETQPLREEDYVPGLRSLVFRDKAGMNDRVHRFCKLCGSPIRETNREVAEDNGNRCENCVQSGYTYAIANGGVDRQEEAT